MRFAIQIILLALSIAACVTTKPGPLPPQISRAKVLALPDSVFEIVVPKPEDRRVTYADNKKLPKRELPYAERLDRYVSIGTAFALSADRLVSAAHVFDLDKFQVNHQFFVRDRTGKVHAITQVRAFSEYRDLIEFTIATKPAKIKPLKTARDPVAGDTVYTVGNAQGEGIAIRSGQISSFTFEQVKGAWKDIRTSAPASAGNSGGPLLNTLGEVLGVVVAGNGYENLNYAVPIEELKNLSAKEAEFFVPSSEGASDDEPKRDWTFRTKVPASIETLARRAETDRRRYHLKQWARARKTERGKSFPHDPSLRDFLARQVYATHLQQLVSDGKGSYAVAPDAPAEEATTKGGERVQILVTDDNQAQTLAQIEITADGDPRAYVKKPELLMDALIEALELERDFNGRRFRFASFGAPDETRVVTDGMGRGWIEAIWRTHEDFTTSMLHCLPAPRGFGCRLDRLETEMETLGLREKFTLREANELAMSYWGEAAAWRRFTALPTELVPPLLRGLAIGRESGGVAVNARDLTLRYPQNVAGADPRLFVGVGYGTVQPLVQEIREVRIDHGDAEAVFAVAGLSGRRTATVVACGIAADADGVSHEQALNIESACAKLRATSAALAH